MTAEKKGSTNFKEGLKGTTLFGGVQAFSILISILRSKVLAIFLGPAGVGVLGLLFSTLDVIYSISNMGLGTSAVREISEANRNGDINRLSRVSKVFKSLVWITGLFGLCVCLFFSPYWSYASFGNHDYVFTFCFLSLTILFRLLSEGQNSLLQGTHNLQKMAKSRVFANALGLSLTVPFYYFWGVAGIAPSLFVTYLLDLLLSWYYSRQIKREKVNIHFHDLWVEGSSMLKLGFFISLSGLFSTGVAYIIRLFISKTGGLDDVGLYTAGFAIVNTYVGMIFTAIGIEYFPRLSSFVKNNEEFKIAINQQMEICILLIGPLICLFIIFGDIGIRILYSSDFLGIDKMICFAMLAILFKAPSWCCSYAILSKGDSIVFFWTEFASLIIMLVANLSLYALWGLTGLGVAYIVLYAYYMLQEWFVCKKKYGFRISQEVYKLYLPIYMISIICLCIAMTLTGYLRYSIGLIFIALSFYYSIRMLNKKINILELIKSRIK